MFVTESFLCRYPTWDSFRPDRSSDWPPQSQAGLGDAIHPAAGALHNMEESGSRLLKLAAVVVSGQVDPLLRQIVNYEQVPNELLQHIVLWGEKPGGGEDQQSILKTFQFQNVECDSGIGRPFPAWPQWGRRAAQERPSGRS